ncbi:DUF4339 domain-containing protein [Porphyromonas vaginalis]|uniref:DUF4339 domain-containing protein n=1 Tax=Porphyromonas vaginalis TaxID=3044325 RepID=UPI00263667F3|nr:DUF4339 domain-containing protein [Porphyromonas vaginalis]
MKQYYIIRNDQPAGPYTLEELAAMEITPDTIVWAEDIVDWIPAYQVGLCQKSLPQQKVKDRGSCIFRCLF